MNFSFSKLSKHAFSGLLIACMVAGSLEAAPGQVSNPSRVEKSVEPLIKPHIARDLEGLDPREGGLTKGLRGTFVIKHYISGPWKGGTAVIEIASDLSYAEIRIFDEDSNLQRIYSIQPKSQKTQINPAKIQNPIKMVEQVGADDAQNNAVSEPVARSPERESAVQAQTEQAEQAQKEKQAREEEEPARPMSRRDKMASRRGEIRDTREEAPPAARHGERSPVETAEEEEVKRREQKVTVAAVPEETRRVIRVRRKRPRKASSSALDTPLSGSPKKPKDEYYYEEVVVVTKKKVPAESGERSSARDDSRSAAYETASAKPVPSPLPTPARPPSEPAHDLEHAQRSGRPAEVHPPAPTSAGARKGQSASMAYDDSELPDVTDAVSENESERGENKGDDKSERKKRKSKKEEAAEGKKGKLEPWQAAALPPEEPETKRPAPEPEAEEEKARPADGKKTKLEPWQAAALQTEEAEKKRAARDREAEEEKARLAESKKRPLEPGEAAPLAEEEQAMKSGGRRSKQETVTEDLAEAKKAAAKLASDNWTPPTAPAPLPDHEVIEETPAPRAKRAAPVEDMTELKRAAARMDSDQWSPKPAGPAPTDAELGLNQPTPAASARREGTKQAGDDLAPLSDQVKRGGGVGAGSDTWAPSGANPKLDAKEERTLAMLNNLKPITDRPVKVNRDVNNPEEGVRPFYSLEKYSGAQFGRHREFERRVMYKQNKNSPVKGYEFYIDEVDRKQEKHYLYYYKIDPETKKSKLIATEKHEKVTFLSNYDIGSEDKGKIVKE